MYKLNGVEMYEVGDIVEYDVEKWGTLGSLIGDPKQSGTLYLKVVEVGDEGIIKVEHDLINGHGPDKNQWNIPKTWVTLHEDSDKESNYLTTKQLIDAIEEMNNHWVDRDEDSCVFGIRTKVVGYVRTIATVDKSTMYSIDTDYSTPISKELFELLVRYAYTPLEFRDSDATKYYLVLPGVSEDAIEAYYNQNLGSEDIDEPYMFASIHNTGVWKTQFTLKEIEALPNQELIDALRKVEVEND